MQRYEISQYFEIGPRQNWFISRFLWRRSLWCSTDSSGQLYFSYTLDIRFYLSPSVNETSHFSNFAEFRQLQIPNAKPKYYEILPAHTKTPRNTTRKIVYRYCELKYHFLTMPKTIRLLLNKGVHMSTIIWICMVYLHPITMDSVRNIHVNLNSYLIPTTCFVN